MLVFFYFLIIKRDPSELPSVLINQKAPTFKTTTLFDNKPFIFEEESGQQVGNSKFLCDVVHTLSRGASLH